MQWARKDRQPHVELQIFLKKQSSQILKAVIDTGAEACLIYGNPKKFKGPTVIITGLGGKQIEAMQTQIEMKIGNLLLSYGGFCP